MALLLAGGRVEGCGAVPGGEPVAAGESVDVSDVGEQPGCAGRADAVQLQEGGSAGGDELGEVFVDRLDLLVDALQFADQFDREPAAGLAEDVAWLDRGDQGASLGGWRGSAWRHRETARAATDAAG
ncbi:hypothetical protein [Kibdelosporangium aridum]|uniref:hypothetical protein n=1 Tax=Kibdelosporangium aridum TaxID=2030 RepID=UPI0035EC839C